MRRRTRAGTAILSWALALALAAAVPAFSAGPGLSSGARLRLFPVAIAAEGAAADDAAAFGEALREAFFLGLERAGFDILDEASPAASTAPLDLAIAARAVDASWAALARLSLDGSRLSYSVAVYEAGEGALVAAESFSTYAGLGALPLMQESARVAAAKAAARRDEAARGGAGPSRRPVQYRITLRSRDEGAEVSLGDPKGGNARIIGKVEGGELLFPYIALEEGSRIAIGIAAPGKRSAVLEAALGSEALEISAPPLGRIVRQSLSVDTGPGRLFGLGLGYRYFIYPDWAFAFADARAFAGYSFLPGASPVYHAELWQGLGSYIASPPGALVRAGLACGAGLLFSSSAALGEGDRVIVDLALLPIEAFIDCRLGGSLSARLSLRSAFSLGLDRGIAPRGWMGSRLPALASAGLAWRL